MLPIVWRLLLSELVIRPTLRLVGADGHLQLTHDFLGGEDDVIQPPEDFQRIQMRHSLQLVHRSRFVQTVKDLE